MGSNERELLDAARAGDATALERLLLIYYPRVTGALAAKIPNELKRTISTEDIFQDVCIRAFASITTFNVQGEDGFYRWLATIARNRLIDEVRKARADRRGGGRVVGDLAVEAEGSRVAGLLQLAAVDTKTPSRCVRRDEALAAMQIALGGMEERHRQILTLRHIEELSVAQTAQRLGMTEGAVKMATQRAMQALQEAMGRVSLYFSTSE